MYNYHDFHSQFRSDYWISEYMYNNKIEPPRLVVDIGCGDGQHHSNSKHWIDRGWSAVLVDGNKGLVDKCRALYAGNPNVMMIEGVVTPAQKSIKYRMDGGVGWSTHDAIPSSDGVGEVMLSEICGGLQVGILSIDIEGSTSRAVKDIPKLNKQPMFLILENNKRKPYKVPGYQLLTQLDINFIYIKEDEI